MGEPPYSVHPVVWTGRLSELFIRGGRKHGYIYGVMIWFLSVLPGLLVSVLVCVFPETIPRVILQAYLLKTTFSISMLRSIVVHYREGKENRVQELVRRDLNGLPEGLVNSAAVESLFESMVDGILSPLFWYLIGGLPLAMLQRLANTMDSMVGYRQEPFTKMGYFSAKVDTLLNFIPARLAAGILVLTSPRKLPLCLRITRESGIESVNAKLPIGFAACLLGVTLEKRGHYLVRGGENLPTRADLNRAVRVFDISVVIFLLILASYYSLYDVPLLSLLYSMVKVL